LKEGDVRSWLFFTRTNGGGRFRLPISRVKHVILYFYPKDDTPGCTKEACAFRDQFATIKKKGGVVLRGEC
jgi:peroxiredoxin Q/BCP